MTTKMYLDLRHKKILMENYSINEDNNCDSCSKKSSSYVCGDNNLSEDENNLTKQLKECFSNTVEVASDVQQESINSAAYAFHEVEVEAEGKLKDSTKRLLCLLEDIQAKIQCNNNFPSVPSHHENQLIKKAETYPTNNSSVTNIIGAGALRRLEQQTRALENINVKNEEDDCSVYKRLTRKCNCLNHPQYNDFVIQFNEQTKYSTSTFGEIVKNMRIIKKFLYMGGDYSKNALMFLNEGMADSTHSERIDIVQACAHADMCNVFDDHSIVVTYIAWPCKYEYYGDTDTQRTTASYLYKLSQIEEGRRYLNFTSKVANDIRRVIRKLSIKLDYEIVDTLESTLNLLIPPLNNTNPTYYCKYMEEGYGNKTIMALIQFRKYMAMDEVFTHLDMLHNMSKMDAGKLELTSILPKMAHLFKTMLAEYDNSEMNIIVTNILNNIITKNIFKDFSGAPKTLVMQDTSTDPIKMKNGSNQIPIRKNPKKFNRSKIGMKASNAKSKQKLSQKKVSDWDRNNLMSYGSKNHNKAAPTSTVIIVPVEEDN